MKLKTTRQLIDEIQDRSVFVLVWAIVWRFLVAYLLIVTAIGVLDVLITSPAHSEESPAKIDFGFDELSR